MPMPAPNMRMGLKMAFATQATSEILSGVTVSMMPRKLEKPTVDMVSGITPGRRHRRYGSEKGSAADDRRAVATCCCLRPPATSQAFRG